MGRNEMLNFSIGILALIISLISLIRTRKNTAKLIELEEIHAEVSKKQLEEYKKQEIEKNKAKLNITLRTETNKGWFIIKNTGLGTASNILFALQNRCGKNPLEDGDINDKNPYSELHYSEEYFLKAYFSLSDTQRVFKIELSWSNEDGTNDKRTFTVSK